MLVLLLVLVLVGSGLGVAAAAAGSGIEVAVVWLLLLGAVGVVEVAVSYRGVRLLLLLAAVVVSSFRFLRIPVRMLILGAVVSLLLVVVVMGSVVPFCWFVDVAVIMVGGGTGLRPVMVLPHVFFDGDEEEEEDGVVVFAFPASSAALAIQLDVLCAARSWVEKSEERRCCIRDWYFGSGRRSWPWVVVAQRAGMVLAAS